MLELERSKRFGDRAVTAGLDAFLRNLSKNEASQLSAGVLARIHGLPPGGYRGLGATRRQQWIEVTLATLAGQRNGPPPRASVERGRERGDQRAAEPQAAHQRAVRAGSTAHAPSARDRAARGTSSRGARPTAAQRATKHYAPGELDAQGLSAPVTALRGVSFSLAVKLEKLGIENAGDLLMHLPRRHADYGAPVPIAELEFGREQTVRAHVWNAHERQIGFRMKAAEATVGDSSGMLKCVWFNQPWVAKQLPTNAEIVVSGKVSEFQGRPKFDNPEWEPWSDELLHTGRLVPVYPLTAGIANRSLRRIMREAIDRFGRKLADPLPQEMRARLRLTPLADAVAQFHYPADRDALEAARRRLAFDELLPIQVSMLARRRHFQRSAPAEPLPMPARTKRAFNDTLPFTLTGAQERVLFDVLNDLRKPVPMSRLVQGDVGSGKTVIAAAALIAAAENGRQGVMMAPTEILAEQHFRTLCALLEPGRTNGALFSSDDQPAGDFVVELRPPFLSAPLRVALLTGSLKTAGRRRVSGALERGEIHIACGTHALIQGGVRFNDLGIAIVDEQHRFGVMQRAALREKGAHGPHTPHMLVMTATPIPRTLALTIYGDLDISVIDEMPPGRQEIKTTWVAPDERADAERFVRQQVEQGRQAFIICPLVEESESLDVKAATAEFDRLRKRVFPDLRLELLHGRMPAKQKDAAMRRFRVGEADILVSTAVIEVGIDVPNATVMLIEGAERFGLAQLHQFRGRVGRGAEQSYCLLLSEEPSEEARRRLELMEETTDGFRLAEADLDMRGPGQFFGTKQSGLPGLKVAKLTDVKLIELTRQEAERLLDDDPGLTRPEHRALNERAALLIGQVVDEEH